MRQRLIAVAVVVGSACTALHFSRTNQQSVVTQPSSYHFGSGGTQLFMVTPAYMGADDIIDSIVRDVGCSSQWTLNLGIDPQGMPPGPEVCDAFSSGGTQSVFCPRNYSFNVSFAGTQSGLSSCDIYITTYPNGGSGSAFEQYKLTLTGSGSGATGIEVTPPNLVFTDVQQGSQSGSQVVRVRNLATNTTIITVQGTLMGGPTYAVSPNNYTSFSLPAGSQANFNVTCTPPGTSMYNGSLYFMSSGSGGSAGSSAFTCNGINSTVTVSPDGINFDSTLVGRPPNAKQVMIGGDNSAVINSVSLDGSATAAGVTYMPTNLAGMTVGSGKTITLNYSAAAMHEAGPLGKLFIQFSVDPQPRTVGISGQALIGGVGTNPASVEFGGVCAGDTATKDIEVYASEPGDVQVMTLTKPAAPFDAMAVQALPKMLGGNHSGPSLTVRATYRPTTPGDFQDALAVTSNVPMMNMHEVQLHGIALAEGIAATPNLVHFGTTGVGTTTSIKEVQFTNCGTTDLMYNGAQITGANAREFTLIGANPPHVLAPTESEVFMVIMQPTTAGPKVAQLVIAHGAGSTTADLDGMGEGGGNKDRETYYACSAGRGAGLWPLLIALLALRRRRR